MQRFGPLDETVPFVSVGSDPISGVVALGQLIVFYNFTAGLGGGGEGKQLVELGGHVISVRKLTRGVVGRLLGPGLGLVAEGALPTLGQLAVVDGGGSLLHWLDGRRGA